jgi:hypothetical protein
MVTTSWYQEANIGSEMGQLRLAAFPDLEKLVEEIAEHDRDLATLGVPWRAC